MARIGMAMGRDRIDDPLAMHFGKAKWLLVFDTEGEHEFVRNTGLNGRWVAATLAAAGCTHVIASHLGQGAFSHLRAAGLRVHQGRLNVPVRELVRLLGEGALPAIEELPDHGGHCTDCGPGLH